MRPDWLCDAASRPYLSAGVTDGVRRNRLGRWISGEQPFSGTGTLPIIPEQGVKFWWKHDIAVFTALTALDPDDHALAVDRGGCEVDGLGNPKAGRVTNRQDHAVLPVIHRAQEPRHFVLAHHDGKLPVLPAGGYVVLDNPLAFERDGVE